MPNLEKSSASTLCKSCGLCCSGHLFAWVRLNASELDPVEKLGVTVIRDDPHQRGFNQPCPLWNGTCTVYDSLDYPRSCGRYKCNVLRRLLDDDISLPDALSEIQETLGLIREIEAFLPSPKVVSFRERLIDYKERLEAKGEDLEAFEQSSLYKVDDLLNQYNDRFGVDDFIDYAT